ncbi:MAG: amidohydrolase, partial [Bacillota bacterium]
MLAIINGRLMTVANGIVESGTILVENGKIVAVGNALTVPADAEVIDAKGMVVTPGLIDAHSHVGIMEEANGWAGDDTNECTDPNTAQVRALDGINPADIGFQDCREGGVTTVQIGPGSGNVIGGEMLVLKTCGHVVDQMVVKAPSAIKAALGENPKRVYGSQHKMPSTRMGSAAVMRDALMRAQAYMKKQEQAKDEEKAPARDLKLENLAKVLRRELPLRVHAHRADDIVTALRIADEFGITVSIEHCTEGHLIADYIAQKNVFAAVGPTLSGKSKVELKELGFHTPVALAKAGVKFAIVTDHPIIPEKYLNIAAGLAVREGLDEALALEALTITPATML